jgi:hypothetical protein
MTGCDDDLEQREIPSLDGASVFTPDPESGILITDRLASHARTAREESDVHSALCLGLASYLGGLSSAIDGRFLALSRVVGDWSDYDDGPVPSPSAVVGSTEVGGYLQLSIGAAMPEKIGPDGSGRLVALTSDSIYELQELRVEVMCEDKIQRRGVRQMLERALNPVDWMAGFRLLLPRYHNAIGEYLLVGAQQLDASDTAGASLWPLVMRLTAQCVVYHTRILPLARPSVSGTITSR